MRLSNGVAKLENGIGSAFNWLRIKSEDLRCAVSDKFSQASIEVQATQLAHIRTRLKTLRPLDRQEVELRASEINMVREAAEIRRAEHRLRRDIARSIARGEMDYSPLIPEVQRD